MCDCDIIWQLSSHNSKLEKVYDQNHLSSISYSKKKKKTTGELFYRLFGYWPSCEERNQKIEACLIHLLSGA